MLIYFRSLSIYFSMFGVSLTPFFDISASSLYGKEERKTKYLLGKCKKIVLHLYHSFLTLLLQVAFSYAQINLCTTVR